ncbi:MAG: hypothetical protein GY718_07165, partial [Lentisphaerae bacterium]|nr:hypothetical protein [Lentisphaerota bacterium]
MEMEIEEIIDRPAKKIAEVNYNNLVYVEQESPLDGKMLGVDINGDRMARLCTIQRAIGVIEGVVKTFDPETNSGYIELDGHQIPISDARFNNYRRRKEHTISFDSLIGETVCCTFYPTSKELPEETSQESLKIPDIQISNIRQKSETLPSGYVEAIGKLEKILPEAFVISIRSKAKDSFFIPFSGAYPYPDELGEFVWVTGNFDAKTQLLQFKEANAITFVSPKKAAKAAKILRQPRARKKKLEQSGSDGKNLVEPSVIDWDILAKRVNRTMINAKIKIVLRKLPDVKKSGNMIWIPLENQPKAVPGGLELSKTHMDLLITQKMWDKAKKRAETT